MPTYSHTRNYQQHPVGGGLGQPGERRTRFESLKSEIARVRQTTGGMILFATVASLSIFNIAGIVGPLFGWGIGLCVIVCVFVYLRAWIAHKHPEQMTYQLEIGIVIVFVIALACWSKLGETWVSTWWIDKTLRIILPLWIKVILVVFHCIVVVGLSWGVWGFFIELVDPSGPTPPRAATPRDKAILPWSEETYGGRYFEWDDGNSAPPKAVETIALDVTEEGGSAGDNHRFVPDLPALPAFRQFCAHVAQGHITFSEAKAREYLVPLDDVTDERGTVLMRGLRSFRAHALKYKWIAWKNPAVHARGVKMSSKFLKMLAAIGNVEPDLSLASNLEAESAQAD